MAKWNLKNSFVKKGLSTVWSHPVDEWIVLGRKKGTGESETLFTQKGPFSQAQVVAMLNQGEVKHTDYIWRTGFESWVRIGDLEEFFSQEPAEDAPFVGLMTPLIPTPIQQMSAGELLKSVKVQESQTPPGGALSGLAAAEQAKPVEAGEQLNKEFQKPELPQEVQRSDIRREPPKAEVQRSNARPAPEAEKPPPAKEIRKPAPVVPDRAMGGAMEVPLPENPSPLKVQVKAATSAGVVLKRPPTAIPSIKSERRSPLLYLGLILVLGGVSVYFALPKETMSVVQLFRSEIEKKGFSFGPKSPNDIKISGPVAAAFQMKIIPLKLDSDQPRL